MSGIFQKKKIKRWTGAFSLWIETGCHSDLCGCYSCLDVIFIPFNLHRALIEFKYNEDIFFCFTTPIFVFIFALDLSFPWFWVAFENLFMKGLSVTLTQGSWSNRYIGGAGQGRCQTWEWLSLMVPRSSFMLRWSLTCSVRKNYQVVCPNSSDHAYCSIHSPRKPSTAGLRRVAIFQGCSQGYNDSPHPYQAPGRQQGHNSTPVLQPEPSHAISLTCLWALSQGLGRETGTKEWVTLPPEEPEGRTQP